VSDPDGAADQLAELEVHRASGCLTITSRTEGQCRIHLLGGRVILVEGPSGDGASGLARALAWPEVTLSFDEAAEPPSEPSVDRSFEEQAAEAIPGVSLLADDVRLTRLGRASLALGGLALIGPWLLCAVALVAAAFRIISYDLGLGMAALAVVLFVLFAAGWLTMYVRFRLAFLRRALEVQGHAQNAGVQRDVGAGPGVISGKPLLLVKMQTRCATGSLGRCRIELYSGGLQIWKGPERPEPRWQFAYGDVVQAECLDLFTPSWVPDLYVVRLVTARPSMAFLFGGVWVSSVEGQNRNARLLTNKLRQHGVATFDATLDS